MFPLGDSAAYAAWVARFDTLDENDRHAIAAACERLPQQPLFSLLLPPGWMFDGAAPLLASLARQAYPNWELWVEADFPLEATPELEARIFRYPATAEGAAAGLNAALARAAGGLVVPVAEDMVIAEAALFELAHAACEHPAAELLYGDEDRIDLDGRRHSPRFKSAWDPELVLGRDSVGALAAYRAEPLRRAGGFPELGRAASGDMVGYATALRTVTAGDDGRVIHVPAILCHRQGEPAWDPDLARSLVRQHLDRSGETGAKVSPAPLAPQWSRITRPTPSPEPLVSVIVPTRDGADLLARCADGLLRWTDYPNLELLIVDNGSEKAETFALFETLSKDSRVRILPQPGPFNFSALNNRAAEVARGEVLVLLNNDTEVIEPDWLSELVSHVMRPSVGAVGAKLIYANGRVQHAGVVLGRGSEITHLLRLSDRNDPGPDGELALTRCFAAVTGACLATRRELYLQVGGLDEENFAISFNDIDLCLRIGSLGYRVVWTPFAALFHLESVSRGHDESPEKRARMLRELGVFVERWGPTTEADGYHNPNLEFGWNHARLAAPPRRTAPWRRPAMQASAG